MLAAVCEFSISVRLDDRVVHSFEKRPSPEIGWRSVEYCSSIASNVHQVCV